jgi:REP element-mobilizing transposase RayT
MPKRILYKYRTASPRLQNWDYTRNADYFVTICTQNREDFFGKITGGRMQLSAIGQIAGKFWNEISVHFPFVELGDFVVMPDHMHGIIMIRQINQGVETGRYVACNVSTGDHISTPNACNVSTENNPSKNDFMSAISPKPGSLPAMVRSYKSAITKWCNANGHKYFAWQRGYYEHIIRNRGEFGRIEEYIRNNPDKYEE